MKKIIGCCIVFVLSIFAIRSLFINGYFPMHDDTQVARVVVMAKALSEGQFPVRWVSDLGYGYGYPIFNFYGPLPYYVGGAIHAIGIDSVVATKWMFGIGAVTAAISMYFLLFPFIGLVGSIVGSILFMYAPYHAVQIFVRGAVGEYWAIAFVPFVILGIMKATREKSMVQGCIVGSIGLAAVILSHTIFGFMTAGLLIMAAIIYWCVYIMQKNKNKRYLVVPLIILIVGLGISAFFWLPAYKEMSATSVTSMVQGASTDFYDHFICPIQLWDSPWGYAGSAPGCVDGLSFKLGKIQIICCAASFIVLLWLLLKRKIRQEKRLHLILIGFVLMVVSIIGVLPMSAYIWRLIPFVSFVQYPWRLLAYIALGIGIFGTYICIVSRKPIVRMFFGIVIIAIVFYTDGKLFHPQYIYDRSSSAFETQEDIRFRVSKISDEYLPMGIIKPKTVTEIVRVTIPNTPTLSVEQVHETDTKFEADLVSTISQTIVIQKAYFPGWKYWINGKEVNPTIARGLPSVILSEGTNHIVMQFVDTPIRTIANWISILFVISVGIIFFYDKKTKT